MLENQSIVIKPIPEEIANNAMYLEYQSLQITCDEDLKNASMKLVQVKDRLKKVEAFRKEIVTPIRHSLDRVNSSFAAILDPLSNVEKILKGKIGGFMALVQKKKDQEEKDRVAREKKEALEKADQATKDFIAGDETALETRDNFLARANTLDPETAVAKQTQKIEGMGRVAQRKIWRWKVVDKNKIPAHLLIVDEKALNQIAKGYARAAIPIPGVEFYEEISVSATAF